jgi:uncharacterized membrane protein YfcA
MEILGYIASVLIGISLGMLGSGGSILTVPVLVYLMHFNPLLATTSSLFIVGMTSLTGGLRAYAKGLVDFRAITEFGIPSIFSIFITRHYILPSLPDTLFRIGDLHISKEVFLMLFFAALMIAAAVTMILSKNETPLISNLEKHRHKKVLPLVLLGLVIGFVTGLLGAGGGFLIVPAFVLFLKLPMKTAVGTSLLIIAINSLFGFLFSLKQFEFNWTVLILFTVLAIAGLFVGGRLSDRIPASSLRKGFAWFILIMGFYVIIKELYL